MFLQHADEKDMAEGTCSKPGPPVCKQRVALRRRRFPSWRNLPRARMALAVAGVFLLFAALSIGWEIIKRYFFPTMPVGLHHAVLTVWAGAVTAVACAIVYIPMRRQHRRLSATAEELSRLLDQYQRDPSAPCRFENPYLKPCHEVLECDQPDCPVRSSDNERCWQVMALHRAPGDHLPARIEMQRCLECDAFLVSCPDKLTELGESFNNLMFLLQQGTEQVDQLRAQMIEKEKMAAVGQVAAGIAHEVGNPLSSISSVVQMLKRARLDPSLVDQLDLIEMHIQRITLIVRQLVTMAHPTVERWERVNICEILEEALRLISFDRRARNVKIDFVCNGPSKHTYALRGQLQQVFINLCLNAFDAMPDGGRLNARIEGTRPSIIIRLEDTGCGVPPEIGRRIFEPFFTTKEPGQGTGLGLAVSYSIIHKHGGTIDFESTVGKGTVFTIELPVLDEAPNEPRRPKHDSAGRR